MTKYIFLLILLTGCSNSDIEEIQQRCANSLRWAKNADDSTIILRREYTHGFTYHRCEEVLVPPGDTLKKVEKNP